MSVGELSSVERSVRKRIAAHLRRWANEAETIPGPPQYEDALRDAANAVLRGDDSRDADLRAAARATVTALWPIRLNGIATTSVRELRDAIDPEWDPETDPDEVIAASAAEQGVAIDGSPIDGGPVIDDFWLGIGAEMEHQLERWGLTHDKQKSPSDWYWLIGFLAGKALRSHLHGDVEKALHHCISTAAVLGHWHAAIKASSDPSLKVEHDPSKAASAELDPDRRSE